MRQTWILSAISVILTYRVSKLSKTISAMATGFPQGAPLTIFPFETQAQPFAPDRLKLRNSCKACAASKLKCSQWKPSCARCLKRHLPCEYVVAKRGGRKPKGWFSGGEAAQNARTPAWFVQSFPQAGWTTLPPLDSSPSPKAIDVPSTQQRTPSLIPPESPDVIENLFGPLSESDGLFNPLAQSTFTSDIDFRESSDFFTSDSNSFGSEDFFPLDIDPGSHSASEMQSTVFSYVPVLSQTGQTSSDGAFGDEESSSTDRKECVSALQVCFAQALGLMKQLSVPVTEGTIQGVIARNELAIEALDSMLQCSCSRDGYLLAIMGLLLSKLLDRYTLMARSTLSSSDNGAEGGGHGASPTACSTTQEIPPSQNTAGIPKTNNASKYRLEGADSSRMAAQLIMGELHRLKRLVDKLSITLKSVELENERDGAGAADDVSNKDCGDVMQNMTPPFPSDLHVKLDRKLRALSTGLIQTLRRL